MKHRLLPYFAAAATAIAVLAGTFAVDRAEQARFQEKSRADALTRLSVVRARLESALNSRLYLARGLVAFAQTHPAGDSGEFRVFARALLSQQVGVRSVQLAKDSVVSHVYPLQGNQAAIGLKLLEHPEQREAALRAITSGKTVVAGPVDLVQGGVAFISRTPVFLESSPDHRFYWGLATVVIERDALFQEAGLLADSGGFHYALRGRDATGVAGAPFWGYGWIFRSNPVVLDVTLPNGSWQIAALPIAGWGSARTVWLRSGGGVLALLAGLLVWFLVRRPTELREAVTQAVQAVNDSEAELRRSEAQFRALLENARHFAIYQLEADSSSPYGARVLALSASFEEMTGLSDPYDFGSWFGNLHDDDRQRMIEANQRGWMDGVVFDERFRYYHVAKKEWVWLNVVGVPVMDGAGRPTHFNGLVMDITKKVNAEALVQRANEELEERVRTRTAELRIANEHLRNEIVERQKVEGALQIRTMAIEAAAEAVVITDRNGTIEYVNPAFSAVTGYALEEVIGRRPSILRSGVHDQAFYQELWHTILAGQAWHGEITNRRKSGELYVEEMTVAPVNGAAGQIIRFVAIKHDITARKRTEQALAEQNALYLALMKAQSDVGEGVILIDDGRISFANEAMARLSGYSIEEIQSFPSFAVMVHPDDRESVAENHRRRLAGEQFANRYEIGLLTKGGERREIEIAVATLPTGSGTRVVVVVLDVTLRKEAVEALRRAHDDLEARVRERTEALAESERKHRILLEHLPQRVFFKDQNSTYVSCNQSYAKDLGLRPEQIEGRTDFEFFPAELALKYRASDKRVLARGAVEEFEEQYFVDGEMRHVQTVKTPVPDDRGEIVGVLGIFWDITDRKRAEDVLRHHAQIIDQIHDSVIATDLDGYITFWNQGAEAMFGYGAEESVGRHVSFIYTDADHPSIRERVIEQLATRGVYEVEAWRQKKSGEAIYVHLVLSLLKDRNGKMIGLIGNSMDITERMRLEREIIDVSEEEQKRIGQELHDGLGQDLTGVAFLSKVLEQKLLAKDLPEALDAAEVVQFVNQAVSKTRILARGLYPVELETNGLMSALEQLASRIRTLFGIGCVFRCPEPVLVDDNVVAINLYRIAQEAVTNAVKHGNARNIVIELLVGDIIPRLAVFDDGQGFDYAALEPGKGMGLHIMQYRAKMVGAALGIGTSPQGGIVVSVS